MHITDEKPVDIKIQFDGNRAYGVDVYADGTTGVIKSDLGTFKSPEHAEVFWAIMTNPRYLLFVSQGKITAETVDRIVEALRAKRANQVDQQRPGDTVASTTYPAVQ